MSSRILFHKVYGSGNQPALSGAGSAVHENGRLQWPRTGEEAKQISDQQLRWLLEEELPSSCIAGGGVIFTVTQQKPFQVLSLHKS